jgi:hypothetical protein
VVLAALAFYFLVAMLLLLAIGRAARKSPSSALETEKPQAKANPIQVSPLSQTQVTPQRKTEVSTARANNPEAIHQTDQTA